MIAVPAPRNRGAGRVRRGAALRMETLEPRQLLSVNTTTVNDNWRLTVDNDMSGTLTVGDTVDSFNDDGIGTVTGSYGVNAFGTVTSSQIAGTFTGSLTGAATINDAIANTSSGGTVRILAGTYTESVSTSGNSVTLAPEEASPR